MTRAFLHLSLFALLLSSTAAADDFPAVRTHAADLAASLGGQRMACPEDLAKAGAACYAVDSKKSAFTKAVKKHVKSEAKKTKMARLVGGKWETVGPYQRRSMFLPGGYVTMVHNPTAKLFGLIPPRGCTEGTRPSLLEPSEGSEPIWVDGGQPLLGGLTSKGVAEAFVAMQLHINEDGQVDDGCVVNLHVGYGSNTVSPGDRPEIEEMVVGATVGAVRSWGFRPATKDGQPVGAHTIVNVSFRSR